MFVNQLLHLWTSNLKDSIFTLVQYFRNFSPSCWREEHSSSPYGGQKFKREYMNSNAISIFPFNALASPKANGMVPSMIKQISHPQLILILKCVLYCSTQQVTLLYKGRQKCAKEWFLFSVVQYFMRNISKAYIMFLIYLLYFKYLNRFYIKHKLYIFTYGISVCLCIYIMSKPT